MTSAAKSPYAGYRFPGEVISHAVWLYFRFPLSLRMVEEMLAARGIDVSHETVRQWARKFGQDFANQIRRPGEPAPAIRAAPARPRSRLGRDGHSGHRHRSRLEWGNNHAPRGVQGPDRPRHPRRGRRRPLLRGDPARAELLGWVPAAGPVRLSTMPDR